MIIGMVWRSATEKFASPISRCSFRILKHTQNGFGHAVRVAGFEKTDRQLLVVGHLAEVVNVGADDGQSVFASHDARRRWSRWQRRKA